MLDLCPTILFVDSFTTEKPRASCSSDVIGYGKTAADVIVTELGRRGFAVTRCPTNIQEGNDKATALRHVLDTYQETLRRLLASPPDLIFIFHAFSVFPTELRRIALSLGLSIPMIGYTHGSHWDPTDSVRHEDFPGLQYLDLANLACLDRLLLVSRYMSDTLSTSISQFNEELGASIAAKSRVVGLPVDLESIERHRSTPSGNAVSVIYNHSPASSKNGDVFGRVLLRVLERHQDLNVTVTRAFRLGNRGYVEMNVLKQTYPDRVHLGNDMAREDYYRALWEADLQVSTASHESLGISTLEAMTANTCCVLPRTGAYPEVCGEKSAALYEPGEHEFECKLEALLRGTDSQRAIADSLRRRALRYTPDVVGERIVEVIAEILASRSRASF